MVGCERWLALTCKPSPTSPNRTDQPARHLRESESREQGESREQRAGREQRAESREKGESREQRAARGVGEAKRG